ncbi:MAG: hypothetical protein Kow00122_13480 [Thermoleophilia bacterium]
MRKKTTRYGKARAAGDCRAFRELASSAVDGEIHELEAYSLERHLRSCPCCREFRDFVLRTGLLVRQSPPPPLARRPVEGRVLARAAGGRDRSWWKSRRLLGGAAGSLAAGILLGSAVGLRVGGEGVAAPAELPLPRVTAARTLDPSYVPYLSRPLAVAWDAGVIRPGTADEKRLFWVTPMSRYDEAHYRPERL